MLKRITVLTIAAATLAVALFAVPLGIVAARGYVADERLGLQRDAVSAASALRGEIGAPVAAGLAPAGTDITVYDRSSRRRGGADSSGYLDQVRKALAGHEATSVTDTDIVVIAPISDGDQVTGVVMLRRSLADAQHRAVRAWFVLAGLGIAAVGVAALAAQWLARRLTSPVTRLTEVAQRISDGDLGARAAVTGIPELDLLAHNVNVGVERVSDLIDRERRLSGEVSHQLRTPVAGLRLQLERTKELADEPTTTALDDALVTLDRLEDTIAHVIGLARDPGGSGSTDLAAALLAASERWHGLFASRSRPLRIEHDRTSREHRQAAMVPAAANQILDVLLDNAYTHGRGTTSMRVRNAHGALAVDVADEGPTLASMPQALAGRSGTEQVTAADGMGLRFARRLAEAEGARLMLSAHTPPTFTLLVPASAPEAGAATAPVSDVVPT